MNVVQVTVGIDETNGHQGVGFDPSTIVPSRELLLQANSRHYVKGNR